MEPISNPTNTIELRREVANTYDTGIKAVQQYDRVQEYTAEHPEQGSQAVSTAVELPRGRVRTWMDGGKPDPAHALDRLATRDWDDLEYSDPPFTGLNVLVAWIFAGGCINQNWVPLFAINDDHEYDVLNQALSNIGASGEETREDDPTRAKEIRVEEDASNLGRLLTVLGAPTGAKHSDRDLHLPPYLRDAPDSVRIDFARTYILCRGTRRPDRPTTPVQIVEDRSETYQDEVRSLLESVTDPTLVTGDSTVIYLREQAANILSADPLK